MPSCLLRVAVYTTCLRDSFFLFSLPNFWAVRYRILIIQMRCRSRRFSYHRLLSSLTSLVARDFLFFLTALSEYIWAFVYPSSRLCSHMLSQTAMCVCFAFPLKKYETEPTSSLTVRSQKELSYVPSSQASATPRLHQCSQRTQPQQAG
jgi:hypothetical protein